MKVDYPDSLRLNGATFKIYDWFNNNVKCEGWTKCVDKCTICKEYEIRAVNTDTLPYTDDDVVVGFLQPSFRLLLVHDSEIVYPADVKRLTRMKIEWEN